MLAKNIKHMNKLIAIITECNSIFVPLTKATYAKAYKHFKAKHDDTSYWIINDYISLRHYKNNIDFDKYLTNFVKTIKPQILFHHINLKSWGKPPKNRL